jgi:hypothetical protein
MDPAIQYGEPAVLLVREQEFFEIIEKEDDALVLMRPTREEFCALVTDLVGFVPVQAKRIIKPSGERMYFAPGKAHAHNYTGVTWYTTGGVHA